MSKIPWRTIIIANAFFVVGIIFLMWGFHDLMNKGLSEAYEKFILGILVFIPGSYHTFMAFMAWRQHEGYSFEDCAIFEDDRYFY
mmetsp:Transcript_103987/g.143832  ORF Transcript_103987/g.143832 Transcript_103987/m.143832 type:complete len:85 (+) Transcript_103987:192-446(+)